MKVSFGTSVIQKGRRIALDPNLLKNLELGEGDRVQIFLDTDTNSVVVEKEQGGTPTEPTKKKKR